MINDATGHVNQLEKLFSEPQIERNSLAEEEAEELGRGAVRARRGGGGAGAAR